MKNFKLLLLTITYIVMLFISYSVDLIVRIFTKVSKPLTLMTKSLEIKCNRTARRLNRRRTI